MTVRVLVTVIVIVAVVVVIAVVAVLWLCEMMELMVRLGVTPTGDTNTSSYPHTLIPTHLHTFTPSYSHTHILTYPHPFLRFFYDSYISTLRRAFTPICSPLTSTLFIYNPSNTSLIYTH